MMSWEYVAGFFDGEGYIGIKEHGKKHYFYPIASMSQKSKKILEQIQEFLGFGYITINKAKPGMYTLDVSYSQNSRFLKAIMPYLVVKKVVAKLALRYIKYRNNMYKYRYCSVPQKEIQQGEKYRKLIKLANKEKRY